MYPITYQLIRNYRPFAQSEYWIWVVAIKLRKIHATEEVLDYEER